MGPRWTIAPGGSRPTSGAAIPGQGRDTLAAGAFGGEMHLEGRELASAGQSHVFAARLGAGTEPQAARLHHSP